MHRRGIAVLLVEQNVDLALRLADRAYVLGWARSLPKTARDLAADASLLKLISASGTLRARQRAGETRLLVGDRDRCFQSGADEVCHVLDDFIEIVGIAQAFADLFDTVCAGDRVEICADHQDQPPIDGFQRQMG